MIKEVIAGIVITTGLVIFKEFQGFDNTVCLISAFFIIELWSLNDKK